VTSKGRGIKKREGTTATHQFEILLSHSKKMPVVNETCRSYYTRNILKI
jgi:hypothetical protein